MCIDELDHILVVDNANLRVQVFDTTGNYITQFGQTHLANPSFIAVNSSGKVYVSSVDNNKIEIFNRNLATGVSKILANEIALFPNPAADFVTISNAFPSQVSIINVNGEVLYSAQHGYNFVIDVSDYSAGMYFVNLQSASEVSTLKFIKK
jgi:DNA-binding beta-propeller fold protein YncE